NLQKIRAATHSARTVWGAAIRKTLQTGVYGQSQTVHGRRHDAVGRPRAKQMPSRPQSRSRLLLREAYLCSWTTYSWREALTHGTSFSQATIGASCKRN